MEVNMTAGESAPSKFSDAQLSAPGLRAFFEITEKWGLDDAQKIRLLGSPGRTTFYKWKSNEIKNSLPKDTLERISYIRGIHKALRILFPNPDSCYQWITRENTAPLFGGRTALDRMLSGHVSDLFVVRQYLDAQRGGWA
jgi:hypothetical protein